MKLCNSVNPIERYEGRNIDAMPKLLADGRIPMTTSQLMKYRIHQSEQFPDWKTHYFDTSDLIAYGSKEDGKLKFILTVDKNGKITENGRDALELINSNSKRNSGAIELGDKYNSLEGIDVTTENLGKTGEYLTHDEILGSKVWRILARHPDEVPTEFAEDSNLLKEYSTWISSQTGLDANMRVYIDSLSNSQKLRAWYVNWLYCRSDADGRSNLVYGNGRFVGIAPEVQNTGLIRPTLEQSLKIINKNLEGLEIRKK